MQETNPAPAKKKLARVEQVTAPAPKRKPVRKPKAATSNAQEAINDALKAAVSKATERVLALAADEIAELLREELYKSLGAAIPGAVADLIASTRGQRVVRTLPFRGPESAEQDVPQANYEEPRVPGVVEIDGKKVPIQVKGSPTVKGKREFNIGKNGGIPSARGVVQDGIMPFRGQ